MEHFKTNKVLKVKTKSISLTSMLLLISLIGFTQNGILTGKIFDKVTNEPLPYVNVILNSNDEMITGAITDANGLFEIKKVAKGNFNVEIQFMGYSTQVIPVILSENNTKINLGNLYITEDAVALESVVVLAERSTIEQKIDRKVINVGKDLTTVGATTSDIMRNIPSVSVNQDGDISFRGNENVRVLVDGKPTNISARDLLQQIPSTSIKTIELITNPSAKYNPEGMSGIINITLKKDADLGFNGSVNLGFTYGERARYNNALNLNYRAGKLNFYGSYGNRLGKSVTNGTVTRTIENTSQLTKNINENTSHLLKFGIDYFINDNQTLSVYTNQNLIETIADGNRVITFFENPLLDFVQRDITDNDNMSSTYNLDFKHDFKKVNHNIEFEIDYNTFDRDRVFDFIFSGNSPTFDYVELIDDDRSNTTINLDYTNPLSKNSTLELGFETRLRRTDNSYNTGNANFNNSTFFYHRDIHSFYTTFSHKINKWQYNLGIRLEDYNVDSQFNEEGEDLFTFKDELFNIYPSGFLKYSPNEDGKNTYQFSFSRRIDRPSLNQINPIRQINTPQILITGNPTLVPQFTNSVELNYIRKLDKGSFTIGGFYRRINDEINRRGFFDDDNPNLLIIDYDNFDSNNAYGFEFSSSYKLTNWWNLNGSFDVYSRTQKGFIEGESVEVNNTLLNAKLSQSFKATKDLTFQLFTSYSGKQSILQYDLKENFFMNVGARYNFAQSKGTISLNFNDIFRTQRFAFETFRTIIQEGEFRTDSRTVYLGLAYRFGSGKNKRLKRKRRDKNEKEDKIL